jgi:hypothetical protein
MAADFLLENLFWKKNQVLCTHIARFYQKAEAYEKLLNCYEICAEWYVTVKNDNWQAHRLIQGGYDCLK